MSRFSIAEIARALHVLPESVRATCNKMHIPIALDGTFEYPNEPTKQHRWHALLAAKPLNVAERLRRDLGCRPPRVVPE